MRKSVLAATIAATMLAIPSSAAALPPGTGIYGPDNPHGFEPGCWINVFGPFGQVIEGTSDFRVTRGTAICDFHGISGIFGGRFNLAVDCGGYRSARLLVRQAGVRLICHR